MAALAWEYVSIDNPMDDTKTEMVTGGSPTIGVISFGCNGEFAVGIFAPTSAWIDNDFMNGTQLRLRVDQHPALTVQVIGAELMTAAFLVPPELWGQMVEGAVLKIEAPIVSQGRIVVEIPLAGITAPINQLSAGNCKGVIPL